MPREKTHSLKLGREKVGIYPEHKRLYKFVSWRDSYNAIEDFLISKLLLQRPDLEKLGTFKLNMESVNPMRRSRYGNFYLDIKGSVVDTLGNPIANFLDLNFENVSIDLGYETHDNQEILDRINIEKKFGKDQYTKEFSIRTQVLDDLIAQNGGEIILSSSNLEGLDNFVKRSMDLAGWTPTEDNRIHSRVKRLPPYIVVPE
jgi:hypothetical protein